MKTIKRGLALKFEKRCFVSVNFYAQKATSRWPSPPGAACGSTLPPDRGIWVYVVTIPDHTEQSTSRCDSTIVTSTRRYDSGMLMSEKQVLHII